MSDEIKKELKLKQSQPTQLHFPEEYDIQENPKEMVLQTAKELKNIYSELLNSHQFTIKATGRRIQITNTKIEIDCGETSLTIIPSNE